MVEANVENEDKQGHWVRDADGKRVWVSVSTSSADEVATGAATIVEPWQAMTAMTEHLNGWQKEAERSSPENTRHLPATPPLTSEMATPAEVDVVAQPPDAAFQGRLGLVLQSPVQHQMLHSIRGLGVKALKTKLQAAKEQKNEAQIAAIEQELAAITEGGGKMDRAGSPRSQAAEDAKSWGPRRTPEFPGQRDAGVGDGWQLQNTYLVPPCVCVNCVRTNGDLPRAEANAREAAAEEGRGEEERTNSRLDEDKLLWVKGLDIEKLKWEVETRGGFEKVEARREWRQAFFFLSFI